jgi:hypothetical protein
VIVPVFIKAVDVTQIPEHLAELNFIFLRDEAEFERGMSALLEVLATDLEWVREHTRINELATSWDFRNRRSAFLLRGPALEAAEHWIAAHPPSAPPVVPLQRDFINESRRARTRRRNLMTASLTTGFTLSLALAGFAYMQRDLAVRQARLAQEQQFIAESRRTEALEQRDRAERARARVQQLESALRSVDPDNPVLKGQ